MILTRLGNKRRIAKDIIPYFPSHEVYVEPFFGAGGMFFNKPKAKYNIVNDIDSEVFNLFMVVKERPEELKKAFLEFPIHEDLWNYWKNNYEQDPVMKAVRFLFMSNYGYLGKPNILALGVDNQKKYFAALLDQTHEMLLNVQFANKDFRDFLMNGLKRISNRNIFIYCDPPYLGTDNNYQQGFTESDTEDLFRLLVESGHKFMMSEFAHPKILELAEYYDLDITKLRERSNLKNRQTEIIITNYLVKTTLFD